MPTPREQYVSALDEIAARYSRLDDETIRRLVELLQEVRRNLAAALAANPDDMARFRLSALQDDIDATLQGFQSRLGVDLGQFIVLAGQLGAETVANPLAALDFETGSFNRLPPQQVNIALDFSAELVQNITDDMRAQINAQIRQAGLAEKTPFQAMKDISRVLGIKAQDGIWGRRTRPEIVSGVAARAETIVRTEMTRFYNLAQQSTQQAAAATVPGLRKRWIATPRANTRRTHLNAHSETFRRPIPVDQAFEVGNSRLMYPGDPRGEAKETINCRCTMATVVAEIGVIRTNTDRRVQREIKTRQAHEPIPFIEF